VSHRSVIIRPLFCLFLGVSLPLVRLPAAEPAAAEPHSETLAEQTLREIAARQRELFAKAEKEGEQFDEALFHGEAQSIASSYDILIQKNPTFVTAYAAYGVFLGKVGMTRQAVAMLLKANQLDPNIATVKNQMAKHLAEDGKPLEALPWLMSAIDLEPKEALYHYNLGQLLLTNRENFVASGEFTPAGIDKSMLDAFQRAADLSPTDVSLAYSRAKAYYAVDPPRWEEALEAWKQLEERPVTTTMRQLVRLQKANVLLKLGRRDDARTALDGITDPKLAEEKKTLLDQLAPKVEK
jgi:tetratricopeptide (TPR) repeat protein